MPKTCGADGGYRVGFASLSSRNALMKIRKTRVLIKLN